MKSNFITFANHRPMYLTSARRYISAAKNSGYDRVQMYTHDMVMETGFGSDNYKILKMQRGSGYWLWKPYIIFETLRNMKDGDILVYNDAGRWIGDEFSTTICMPMALIDFLRTSKRDVLAGVIRRRDSIGQYTSTACLNELSANSVEWRVRPQFVAAWSIWKKSESSIKFAKDWLQACLHPKNLLDVKKSEIEVQNPEFEDHRHDQAVFTILGYKSDVVAYVDLSSTNINRRVSSAIADVIAKDGVDRPFFFKHATNVNSLVCALGSQGIDMKSIVNGGPVPNGTLDITPSNWAMYLKYIGSSFSSIPWDLYATTLGFQSADAKTFDTVSENENLKSALLHQHAEVISKMCDVDALNVKCHRGIASNILSELGSSRAV